MKCRMLLETAIPVLFLDNSIMETTQKAGVKRIPLNNQGAFLSYVCFKEGPACELDGN